MTREYAKLVLDSLATWEGQKRMVTAELVEAIKALSQELKPPKGFSEAAIQAAQSDMQDRQIMEASNDERMRYSRIFRRGFEAGAKWDKEQMMNEAIPCKVFWHDGPLLDYTQEQQDNALERIGANVGDKVKLIIVKEDEK
jgi:hypothetical protein